VSVPCADVLAHRLQLFAERGERAEARLLAEGGAGLLQRAATGRARHTLVIEPPRRTTIRAQHGRPHCLEETSSADDRHHWAVLRTGTGPDTRPFDYLANF
jgi:hypothetical protein